MRTLIDNDAGTSAVELALLSPLFALLALGTVDASRAASEKIRLQQAAARTIEMATAGGLNGDSWNNLAPEAAAAAGVSAQQVTIDQWLECDRIRQDSFTGSCTSAQEVGRYASVAIRNTYSPWFGSALAGMGWRVSRNITIEGKSSVRVQ